MLSHSSCSTLRLLPDLPSAIIGTIDEQLTEHLVAVAPRSPIGYNDQADEDSRRTPALRLLPDLPSAIIRWRSVMPCTTMLRLLPDLPSAIIGVPIMNFTVCCTVAVAPRSPIGYNSMPASAPPRRIELRLLPDLPSAIMSYRDRLIAIRVLRLLPDLPSAIIRSAYRSHLIAIVAVAPRSPIGYNMQQSHRIDRALCVAVAPRSPIGYNPRLHVERQVMLRLLPDLPSAIMRTITI